MSADEQNTPHVIGVMRKLEGIDPVDTDGRTTVKSPDSYLFPDQNKTNYPELPKGSTIKQSLKVEEAR